MYGFQPKHARGKPAQALADGGLVHSITGMLGMRKRTPGEMLAADAKVQERNREAAARVAARAKPAQQAAPAEEKAVSSYAGMSAMQRREKELGLKDGGIMGGFKPGGLIRGPGTETSDSIPARLSAGEYVLPADTVKAVGVDQLDALREATHKPVKGEVAKAARGFFAGGTPGGLEEAYKNWQDKKGPWYLPTPAGNLEERTAEAAYTQALRNSYSGNSSPSATGQPGGPSRQAAPAPDAAPTQSAPQQSAFDASTAKDKTDGLAPLGNKNPPPANPPTANPPTADTPSTTGQQVMPDVYQHGRGQYSDNPKGMGFAPGFTGQPNAQNMAAADALVARQTPAGFQPAGSQPAGVQAPVVRNSTNDWAARKALANAETAASSITNTRRWGGKGAENSPDVQAYQAMLRNDLALQQAQPNMEQAAMRENAANQRVAMQEQGATARDAGRTALAGEELGLKRTAAGFQTRAAQRRESAYDNYSKAKTDEDRQAIAKQFPDLFGQAKDAAHRMEVVRGKTDPMTGQSSGDYVVVQDPKTGEVRQIQMGAAPAAPTQALPKAGEVRNGFRFKGGNPNDQANWTKV